MNTKQRRKAKRQTFRIFGLLVQSLEQAAKDMNISGKVMTSEEVRVIAKNLKEMMKE